MLLVLLALSVLLILKTVFLVIGIYDYFLERKAYKQYLLGLALSLCRATPQSLGQQRTGKSCSHPTP